LLFPFSVGSLVRLLVHARPIGLCLALTALGMRAPPQTLPEPLFLLLASSRSSSCSFGSLSFLSRPSFARREQTNIFVSILLSFCPFFRRFDRHLFSLIFQHVYLFFFFFFPHFTCPKRPRESTAPSILRFLFFFFFFITAAFLILLFSGSFWIRVDSFSFFLVFEFSRARPQLSGFFLFLCIVSTGSARRFQFFFGLFCFSSMVLTTAAPPQSLFSCPAGRCASCFGSMNIFIFLILP